MSNSNQVETLLTSLGIEILSARAGSHEGQFPILDLLGNLRDGGAQRPAGAQMSALCQQGWERMVEIVESGQPFNAEHIDWLRHLNESLARFARAQEIGATEGARPMIATAPEPAKLPEVAPQDSEEVSIILNITQDADLLREFLNESREHLDNIEQGVLVLEGQPTDAETLSTIFRAFHTFKGSAGFLNLAPINRLAHVLESLLDLVRQHKLAADQGVIELILRGRDILKQFLDAIEGQVSGSHPVGPIKIETASLKTDLRKAMAGAPGNRNLPLPPPPQPEEKRVLGVSTTPKPVPAPVIAQQTKEGRSGETAAAERSLEHSAVVRVDTGKLDALLDLIGEMVISQSLVSQKLNRLSEQDPQFARNIAQLSRTTKELQRVGMSLRMVPIRGAFQKMARVVHDIGRKQNKKVQLVTEGEDTELDRGVVEELNDPLLHMIRNSVDHGIESEEVRAKSGKPAAGTIHLRAFHQGGNIVIEIEDDGAGLDRDKILAKALERGLTTCAAELSDEDIFRFIFAAGFSTADKVTDISGRGVGLDVVRRNLERLRGCVDIRSTPGQGARFTLTLPLTLAIIDGLVVRVGEERYIIPTLSVRESFRARLDMITRVQDRAEVVDVRGRLIPLLRLYEHFGLRPSSTDASQGIIIVAQSGANFRCLLVDSLENKQEVVIKNLNDIMVNKNRSLAGAAILGDGRVGLILDVNALVQLDPHTFAKAA
jgi:two-component system chemotaxis sensor kinase CheA